MTDLTGFLKTDDIDDMTAAMYNALVASSLRGELSNIETLAADRVLTNIDMPLQVLTPTAARIVTLPAVGAGNHPFSIVNHSPTYNLTVNNAVGAGIGTVAAQASGVFASDGTAWYSLSSASSGSSADATTTTKGIVKLAGQFGGTADLPTVKGVTDSGAVALTFGSIPDGSFLQRSGTSIAGNSASFCPPNGWIPAGDLWNYASATTFTIVGDRTSQYTKGMRVKFNQSGDKYGVVLSSSYASPSTTVTLVANNDYSITNTTILTPYYSFLDNPQSWPGWFRYTATFTGFSSNPTTVTSKFMVRGTSCIVNHYETGNGTSDATGFTISLPIQASVAASFSPANAMVEAQDNGSFTNSASATITSGATAVSMKLGGSATGWTNVAGKRARFQIMYEI